MGLGSAATKYSLNTLFITLIVAATAFATNVRPEEAAEWCSGNFITQDYDDNWADSIINSTLYFPLTSKYMMLILSKNLYQTHEFENITEDQMKSSCTSLKKWTTGNVTAYDGKSFIHALVPTNVARLYRFNFGFPDVVSGGGYASIALSDSKTWIVWDYCFDNSARAFVVQSTGKSLDGNTRNIIAAHVKSLGFKEKNFLTLNYGSCSEKDGVLTTNGKDLPKPAETHALLLYRPTAIFTKKYVTPSFFFKHK